MRYVFVSIVIYILYILGVTQPIEVGFSYVVTPLQSSIVLQARKVKEVGYFLHDMWLLRDMYKDVYKKYTVLTIEKARNDLLTVENALLKKQLASDTYVKETKYKTLSATMYPNPVDLSLTSRLLDVGTASGVQVGDPVIYLGSLIGVVDHVGASRSRALLLNSPQAKVPSFVLKKETRIEGVVTGQFGTTIALTRLSSEDNVVEGDPVYTSNRLPSIPQGLFIGKIVKIIDSRYSAEKVAYVSNPVKVEELYQVFIITSE